MFLLGLLVSGGGKQRWVGLSGGPGFCLESLLVLLLTVLSLPPTGFPAGQHSALCLLHLPALMHGRQAACPEGCASPMKCPQTSMAPLVNTSNGSPSIYPCADLVTLIWAPRVRWERFMSINGNRVKAVAYMFSDGLCDIS